MAPSLGRGRVCSVVDVFLKEASLTLRLGIALAEANDDPDDEPCESDMGYGQSHRVAAMRGHAGQQAQRPQENSATHTKNMIRRGIGAPLAQSSEM